MENYNDNCKKYLTDLLPEDRNFPDNGRKMNIKAAGIHITGSFFVRKQEEQKNARQEMEIFPVFRPFRT